MREYLTAKKILDLFTAGRRDFSGVTCNNDAFNGFDLHGIILSKANLDFCSFHSANLAGADLSGASLEWTDFNRSDLRGANMEKVRAVWSTFNEAQFEKTNLRGSDLSWSLFFNTNLYGGADLTGALTATIATDPSQITEEGMRKLAEQLGKMHGKLDPELMMRLNLAAVSTEEKASKATGEDEPKNDYSRSSGNSAYTTQSGKISRYPGQKDEDETTPYKNKKKTNYDK